MSRLPPHMIKRMIFMFCVMFPVLLYAEFTGNNSIVVAALAGGVSSGVSVVLFPDPEHLKKLKSDDEEKN
jgi:predicted branched-subunit amino acid permease